MSQAGFEPSDLRVLSEWSSQTVLARLVEVGRLRGLAEVGPAGLVHMTRPKIGRLYAIAGMPLCPWECRVRVKLPYLYCGPAHDSDISSP
jgi:hypothetical protein